MKRLLERREFILSALAGAAACTRQPREPIVPWGAAPAAGAPEEPLYFATATPLGGFGLGVLVKSLAGRPVKVEGNPEHPASLGATDAFAQSWLWSLYDPARAQTLTQRGRPHAWAAFTEWLRGVLKERRARYGEGLHILTQTVTSPTLAWQISELLDAFPAARWHQYEPLSQDPAREAARGAFGRDVQLIYRFDRAECVVSLDADFLAQGPAAVRYARDFMRRRPKLMVIETMPSPTGSKADERRAASPREIEAFSFALAGHLGLLPDAEPEEGAAKWARELLRHRGASVVVAGDQQPPSVHLLALASNQKLGNLGRTVQLTEPVEALPAIELASLGELVRAMETGRVEMLVMLGGDPVRDAPADFDFAAHLKRVKHRVHVSHYFNHTSRLADWHIPEAHPFESWSDIRSFDGTVTIMQPLIAPLWEAKSFHELLAAMRDRPDASGYELLREYWRGRAYELFLRAGRSLAFEEEFEAFWRRSLHDGFVAGTAAEPLAVEPRPNLAALLKPPRRAAPLEIRFKPDATIWDGSFAGNAWLEELPKPITKLTWENAACLSGATAARLGLASGDVVQLRLDGRTVDAPVLIVPGHADGAVTLTLGYGRQGTGFDAGRIRSAAGFFSAGGLDLRKLGRRHALATTQEHHRMEGRPLLGGAKSAGARPPADGYAWGMVIDPAACTGCNACVIACVAENNIPPVGRAEVLRGREMHWLRIDTYAEGPEEALEFVHLPVMCLHCENAPCEPVCPTGATVHSAEGLNEMIYNRCVGSRYCANNCPYKVRRFNFYQYADHSTVVRRMLYNPEVTVRTRGVIEKCTWCIQRISAARIAAARSGRRIRDGEIITACQGVCPSEAIVFGDLNDPDSRVSRLLAARQTAAPLEHLGTRPRTRYLVRERRDG